MTTAISDMTLFLSGEREGTEGRKQLMLRKYRWMLKELLRGGFQISATSKRKEVQVAENSFTTAFPSFSNDRYKSGRSPDSKEETNYLAPIKEGTKKVLKIRAPAISSNRGRDGESKASQPKHGGVLQGILPSIKICPQWYITQ